MASQMIEAASHDEADVSVAGMDCASCVHHVEEAARGVGGVAEVSVNLARGRAVVRFDPQRTSAQKIADAITESGYPAKPQTAGDAHAEHDHAAEQSAHSRAWLNRAIAGIALWLPVELMHWGFAIFGSSHHAGGAHLLWLEWLALAMSTIAIVYVGAAFYHSAWSALKRRASNMDTLIAMGATVAYVYSVVAFFGWRTGVWTALPDLYFMESTGLLALISLGHWLEARARDSAGSAIRELLNLAPATAMRLRGAGEKSTEQRKSIALPLHPASASNTPAFQEVPVAELHIGDRVLVRPGDRVPIDGVVTEGRSSVDESMITGESLPVLRQPGDQVIGGTINADGRLIVRVNKTGSETALSQIIKLVDHAQSTKPPVQKLADKIAAVFVPAVLVVALITAIGWYAWGAMHHWPAAQTWGALAKAVCSVLIIACPCALGLAIPAAVMVGTGRGAKRGILIRDIDALQHAETIDTVVLDKTGTITRGKPAVAKLQPLDGFAEDELLRLAASAELFSEHPIAKAIVAHARQRNLRADEPQSFHNEPGLGVTAQIGEREIVVGSPALLGADRPAENGGTHTLVHVAERSPDGAIRPLGVIHVADEIKPDSVAAVRRLHELGMRTVLLTGDNESAAASIARQAGIDDVRAGVRPAGKAQVISELQNRQSQIGNRKSRVAMVGDGINDAPALAQAELGIAIGSGSDVAKEAGGIVLVGGSLLGVAAAIRLSRATMRTIRQNLFLAFVYNVLAIPLAAFGLLNPLIAAGAMALSDVTVIGNALRLRRRKID